MEVRKVEEAKKWALAMRTVRANSNPFFHNWPTLITISALWCYRAMIAYNTALHILTSIRLKLHMAIEYLKFIAPTKVRNYRKS